MCNVHMQQKALKDNKNIEYIYWILKICTECKYSLQY